MSRFARRRREEEERLRQELEELEAANAAPWSNVGPWQLPARFNFTRDVLEPLADDHRRTGIIFVDRDGVIERTSFVTIASDANRWAAHLREHGLVAGDRLLVHLERTPTWHSVVLGALKAGLIVVPCSRSMDARELEARALHSCAELIVTDADHAAEVRGVKAKVEVLFAEDVAQDPGGYCRVETSDTAWDDPAFILYTSRHGDDPKGAVYSHGYTWALRLQAEHWLDAQPDDVVWCADEASSPRGIRNGLFGPWSRGAAIVIHERDVEAEEQFEFVKRLGVTILCQTPDEYRALADLPAPARAGEHLLRHAVSEGSGLDSSAAEAFHDAFGVTIFEGYAGPESAVLAANMVQVEARPGSIGFPLPGHEVAVIDADGRELSDDTEGEIALRGRPPSVFTGYWGATNEIGDVFRGGWYLTGDRATRTADGYLWLPEETAEAAEVLRDRPIEVQASPPEPTGGSGGRSGNGAGARGGCRRPRNEAQHSQATAEHSCPPREAVSGTSARREPSTECRIQALARQSSRDLRGPPGCAQRRRGQHVRGHDRPGAGLWARQAPGGRP